MRLHLAFLIKIVVIGALRMSSVLRFVCNISLFFVILPLSAHFFQCLFSFLYRKHCCWHKSVNFPDDTQIRSRLRRTSLRPPTQTGIPETCSKRTCSMISPWAGVRLTSFAVTLASSFSSLGQRATGPTDLISRVLTGNLLPEHRSCW